MRVCPDCARAVFMSESENTPLCPWLYNTTLRYSYSIRAFYPTSLANSVHFGNNEMFGCALSILWRRKNRSECEEKKRKGKTGIDLSDGAASERGPLRDLNVDSIIQWWSERAMEWLSDRLREGWMDGWRYSFDMGSFFFWVSSAFWDAWALRLTCVR